MRSKPVGPTDDLEPAIGMLGHRGPAFHPIAGVHVIDAIDHMHCGMMDVTADHPPGAGLARSRSELLLEVTGITDSALDPVLEVGGERPIGKAKPAP